MFRENNPADRLFLLYRGYLPYGRGSVVVRSNPVECIDAVKMTDPGVVTKITGRAFVAGEKPIKVSI